MSSADQTNMCVKVTDNTVLVVYDVNGNIRQYNMWMKTMAISQLNV